VLEGERTAQGAHLPSVETRACGLHGATYLPRETTPRDVSLVAYSASYGVEAPHVSAGTKAFFTQQAARLLGCLLPTSEPDSTLSETRWTKSQPQDPHRQYGPTCEARTEKGKQALLTFANALEEGRALCNLPTALPQAASVRCRTPSVACMLSLRLHTAHGLTHAPKRWDGPRGHGTVYLFARSKKRKFKPMLCSPAMRWTWPCQNL